MTASRVRRTPRLCDLIIGRTSGSALAALGPNLATQLGKRFDNSLVWSAGALLVQDRYVINALTENIHAPPNFADELTLW